MQIILFFCTFVCKNETYINTHMKNRLPVLLAAVLLAVSACGPARYASDFNPKLIDEYALIQPYSHVIYYNERNTPMYDAGLSEDAAELLKSVIESERYPFTSPIRMDYRGSDATVSRWLDSFADMNIYRAGRLRVPDRLVQAVKASGHRYGIVFYSYGHIQSPEGRRLEEMERATVRLIEKIADKIAEKKSNPSYIPRTEPYNNKIYYAVVDTQTGLVLDLACENSFFYSDPVNASDVRSILASLLKPFVE